MCSSLAKHRTEVMRQALAASCRDGDRGSPGPVLYVQYSTVPRTVLVLHSAQRVRLS
jgi:hypothetical protein